MTKKYRKRGELSGITTRIRTAHLETAREMAVEQDRYINELIEEGFERIPGFKQRLKRKEAYASKQTTSKGDRSSPEASPQA